MDSLKLIVADVLGLAADEVHEGLSKDNCEAWDSFNHIVLMNEVEKVLDVAITLEESEKIDNFKDLMALIQKKQSSLE